MSRWLAETSGLESKAQLKAHRLHYYQSRIGALQLGPLPTAWTAVEQAAEHAVWIAADADYEARKAALKAQLAALSAIELQTYFNEISEQVQDINAWLAASAAV